MRWGLSSRKRKKERMNERKKQRRKEPTPHPYCDLLNEGHIRFPRKKKGTNNDEEASPEGADLKVSTNNNKEASQEEVISWSPQKQPKPQR
jgi:hypothetical protein